MFDLKPEASARDPQVERPPARPPERSASPASLLPPADRRLLEQRAAMNSLQAAAGWNAYRRGLIALPELTQHLAAALQTELAIAELTGDSQRQAAAISQYAGTLQQAAAVLEQFPEPFAAGYFAERTQARLLAAEAERELARLSGDPGQLAEAELRFAGLARQYARQRHLDHSLGLATLSQVIYAQTLSSGNPADSLWMHALRQRLHEEPLSARDSAGSETSEKRPPRVSPRVEDIAPQPR